MADVEVRGKAPARALVIRTFISGIRQTSPDGRGTTAPFSVEDAVTVVGISAARRMGSRVCSAESAG